MDFWHVIGKYIADSWDMIVHRSNGMFHARFFIQPIMASLLGFRAGRKDARRGNPPYFWSIFKADDTYDRRAILRDGWGDMGKMITLALVLDIIFTLVEFHWVYPVQSIIMVLMLALLPYLIFRGLANRVASRRRAPASK
jgi:hypothetical protein